MTMIARWPTDRAECETAETRLPVRVARWTRCKSPGSRYLYRPPRE